MPTAEEQPESSQRQSAVTSEGMSLCTITIGGALLAVPSVGKVLVLRASPFGLSSWSKASKATIKIDQRPPRLRRRAVRRERWLV